MPRSQTNSKSITDMWTSLNVSSRLTAVETALAKLGAIVQDLITQCNFGNERGDKEEARLNMQTDDQAERQMDESEEAKQAGCARSGGQPCGMPQVPDGEREGSAAEVVIGEPQFGREHENAFAYDPARLPPVTLQNLPVYIHQLQHDIHVLHNMFICFFGDPNAPSEEKGPEPTGPVAGQPCATGPCDESWIYAYDPETKQQSTVWVFQDELNPTKMSIFEDQLCSLSKQLTAVASTKLEIPQELKDVMQLYDMVQNMHTQLHEVMDTAAKLVAEKEERQHHISV
ncbi:hypothetical protein EVAR_36389_1 [Eumeta japonica]|uniref:Uncharacterized protein n=1 Tax=Eumeta variegata TaxID=151549 RepID=A0A4C1W4E5_EUMVA|nr:hypothetical protein EVAR_36389_1 [Eumeta japonica]